MSNISLVEAKLPPGFRFHPKDEELVCDYLMKKVTHNESFLMIDVDLNKCEPWDIPERACVGGKEWYFYTQRDRKYATGLRTNRATASGYWKATGKDRAILRKGTTLVGMRKTLVFYQGRAPKGTKTEWVMHEFRLEGPLALPKASSKEDWVLCRVFCKNRDIGTVAKQSMGSSSSCYYDDTVVSSSLPPLMDSYISFDQNPPPHHHHLLHHHHASEFEYEQVSCFSSFSHHDQNHTISPTTIFNHISTTLDPIITNNNSNSDDATVYGGGIVHPNLGSCLDPYSCDRKVLKAVLSQLTKMERNLPNNNTTNNFKGSPSLGEGSSESYLSDVGMPNNMWIN